MKKQLLLLLGNALILAGLGACRSEPVEITVVETVEVHKTHRISLDLQTAAPNQLYLVTIAAPGSEVQTHKLMLLE